MLYDNALLLGVYARWGTPLGRRVADETADFLLRELGTAEGGFAAALDADSEGEEGRFYVWTPAQLVEVLGQDDGRWAAALLEVTDERHLRARQLHAPAAGRPRRPRSLGRRTPPADGRARRAGPAGSRRQGGGRLERAGHRLARATPVGCSAARTSSTAALRAGTLLAELHLRDDGSLLRVSRDGVAGRHRGVLEDHGCVAHGFLALAGATGDARVARPGAVGARPRPRPLPRRGRRVLRHGLRRRGAGRPAARPVRQRQPVRYVGDGARAARGGLDDRRGPLPPGRRGGAGHGRVAGGAGAAVRRLVAGRRRGAGRRPARGRRRRSAGYGARRARAHRPPRARRHRRGRRPRRDPHPAASRCSTPAVPSAATPRRTSAARWSASAPSPPPPPSSHCSRRGSPVRFGRSHTACRDRTARDYPAARAVRGRAG